MKNSLYFRLLLPILAAIIFVTACSPRSSHLTRAVVTGEASARAQPDVALVVISVVTQSKQALSAQQENARKSEAVINAVKETAGVEPEIKTSDYSLQPQQSYSENRMPTILGYEARNSVTVMMSELNNVGAVIDAASRAGANSIERVAFILRANNPAHGQTLAEATRQAMSKAQSIAQALGGRIVRVVEEQEAGANTQTPVTSTTTEFDYNSNANMDSRPRRTLTPVEAGTLNVKSQVQVVVEIEAQP